MAKDLLESYWDKAVIIKFRQLLWNNSMPAFLRV